MPKKTKISPDELAAFHKAMEGSKPFVQEKIRLKLSSHKKKPTRTKQLEPDSLYFSEIADLPTVTGEEFISYKQEGISNKTLRKLRKGQYNVEAMLDLHGMSVEEAMTSVGRFLQQCSHEGKRIVLII